MSQEFTNIDRPGNFQGLILDYGLKEMDSGSVAVSLRAHLTAYWENEEWSDWSGYTVHAYGDIWIVKKDGKLNDRQIEALCKCAGWDGDITSIVQQTWKPIACQFTINHETYKDKDQYKIAFLNEFGRTPGGALSNVDPERAKGLAAKYGSQLRAVAGNAKRNSAPTAGMPPAPPKSTKLASDANAALAEAGADDIPF